MNKEQFEAMMPPIVENLVAMIADKQNMSEDEAITKLYSSKLYAMLEQEDTKVWHYSTLRLYELLTEEETTGNIEFPDV